jgi:hypothetical protein
MQTNAVFEIVHDKPGLPLIIRDIGGGEYRTVTNDVERVVIRLASKLPRGRRLWYYDSLEFLGEINLTWSYGSARFHSFAFLSEDEKQNVLEAYSQIATINDPNAAQDVSVGFRLEGTLDPENRLLGSIRLCGTLMHVDAIEIQECEDGDYVAVDSELQPLLDKYSACEESRMTPTTIQGRLYLLIVTPYCR